MTLAFFSHIMRILLIRLIDFRFVQVSVKIDWTFPSRGVFGRQLQHQFQKNFVCNIDPILPSILSVFWAVWFYNFVYAILWNSIEIKLINSSKTENNLITVNCFKEFHAIFKGEKCCTFIINHIEQIKHVRIQ